jgi:hypothetical protein
VLQNRHFMFYERLYRQPHLCITEETVSRMKVMNFDYLHSAAIDMLSLQRSRQTP